MYGLLVGFIFIISFKYIATSCIYILIILAILSFIIYYQLMDFKKKADTAFCPFCQQNSLCMIICKAKISIRILASIFAVTIAFSLMSFIYTINAWFSIAIFVDMLVFYYIYKRLEKTLAYEFSSIAIGFFKELTINFISIFILLIFFILDTIITTNTQLVLSPLLFDKVIHDIHHNCIYFQHYIRTAYFFDLVTQSILNIDGIGTILFIILFIVSLSFLPFLALTLIFKFSYNVLNSKIKYIFNLLIKRSKEFKNDKTTYK